MNFKRISASCFCLLLAGNIAVSAQTVTLGSNKVSLKAAFEKIEKASKYKIAYNSSTINANRMVTISKTKGDVLEILNLLLKECGCTYEEKGNYIIVKPQSKKQSNGQNVKRVTGQLIDELGEPMIGVTVMIKGTTTGVVTDLDGKFSIDDVPAGASELHISYIGYETKDVQISSSAMQIKMNPDNELLDEVVVVGYGTVKKDDLTGSVSAIKPDEFNRGAKSTAQDALVGKVAGVNVVSSSGAPGSGSTIRIRSGASLSASNDPLIVIDGVPVDNSSIEGGTNLIGGINPNDIETFTVLKDASATAIYGSRASNGVIVITTKKGTNGKPKFNYSSNYAVSTTAKRLEVLTADEFRAFAPTVTGVPENVEMGKSNTNWQDEIYRTAFGMDHNISMSGSIKNKTPFRVSAGYTNQNGVIRTNNYQRYTFDGGISPKFFKDHLSLNLNVKASYEDNRRVDEGVVGSALSYDPTRPVKTGSATSATDPGLGYFIWMNGNAPMAIQGDNPMAQLDLQDMRNRIYRSIGNASVNYKVHGFEDLQLNMNLGYDILESKYAKDVPDLAGVLCRSRTLALTLKSLTSSGSWALPVMALSATTSTIISRPTSISSRCIATRAISRIS